MKEWGRCSLGVVEVVRFGQRSLGAAKLDRSRDRACQSPDQPARCARRAPAPPGPLPKCAAPRFSAWTHRGQRAEISNGPLKRSSQLQTHGLSNGMASSPRGSSPASQSAAPRQG